MRWKLSNETPNKDGLRPVLMVFQQSFMKIKYVDVTLY
jgi:hypothetical protein